eukprot:COSAG02_NODE_7499_length_2984_cov_4.055113_4_plen_41_part_01
MSHIRNEFTRSLECPKPISWPSDSGHKALMPVVTPVPVCVN